MENRNLGSTLRLEEVVKEERERKLSEVASGTTYREQNLRKGGAFIDKKSHSYNADAAYGRLQDNRQIMELWKEAINKHDEREIPPEVAEKYEKIWNLMDDLNMSEAVIAATGE